MYDSESPVTIVAAIVSVVVVETGRTRFEVVSLVTMQAGALVNAVENVSTTVDEPVPVAVTFPAESLELVLSVPLPAMEGVPELYILESSAK